MRTKDFVEVMMVLGNEARTCDAPVEQAGILAAAGAVYGYARHRYPEVDFPAIERAWSASVDMPLTVTSG